MTAQDSNTPNKAEQAARAAASKKIGGTIGSRIAGSAAAKAVGSALGSTLGSVVPVVGNLLGGLIGGAAAGAITSATKNVGKALGTLPFAVANLGAQAAGVVATSVSQALSAAFSLFFAALGVLIFLTAIILFIINSGGYVVPPGSDLAIRPGEPGIDFPSIDVGASCPIPGGRITTGSYGSPFPPGGIQHGTNEYWEAPGLQGFVCSDFTIPVLQGCYARQPGDKCYEDYGACDVYGLATDIVYPDGESGGKPVYLPYIDGESTSWSVEWSSMSSGNQGQGVLSTTVNGTSYQMFVTHLEAEPVGGVSGGIFGILDADGPFAPHLHIELRIDGEYVPPDTMCLEGSGGTGANVVAVQGCFEFSGPWPEEALENEVEAAERIMSQTQYSSNLCARGRINVVYTPEQECEQGICYGGFTTGRTIEIYPAGTGTVAESLFTLAHESGHVIDNGTLSRDMMEDSGVAEELPPIQGSSTIVTGICTYPLDSNRTIAGLQVPFTENFAEAIALYIAGSNPASKYRSFSCLNGSFQTRYPNAYRFIRDNIFQ